MATSNAAVTAQELSVSTKAKAKSSFKPFLKSLAAGLLGALVGKGMGRGSFLTGAAVTFAGHMHGAHRAASKKLGQSDSTEIYDGDSPLVAFGLGMMFGGASKKSQELNGTDVGFVEGASERLRELKDDLLHRLYADKFSSSASQNAPAPGTVGAVTFYGNAQPNADFTFDPKTLEEIERNLQQNAIAYERNGNSSSVSGFDGNSDSLESRLM
jgi:hypothetical protein